LSNRPVSSKRWLKAEMHSHCSLDRMDYRVCRHSPEQLIEEAARRGYEVLAITCHNTDIWTESLSGYARSRGVTLIPGMEVAAEGSHHILVYNFRSPAENLDTLQKIRERANTDTLVIAPHPFFPGYVCLRGLLEKNPDVFDAIEYSGFFLKGLDFNRRSKKLAQNIGKPVVACADVHYLWQLGRTFTWIYAEPRVESVLRAIKQGDVRIQTSPLSMPEIADWWATTLWRYAFPVNAYPAGPLNKIENGGCFGAAQQSMKPQRIHIGHQG